MVAILADDIIERMLLMKNSDFLLKYDWSLFLRDQLTITQNWFR